MSKDDFFQGCRKRGEKRELSLSCTLLRKKKKGQETFKDLVVGTRAHLISRVSLKKESKLSHIFTTGNNFTICDKVLLKLLFYPPTDTGRWGPSSVIITSQRDGSRVLEKDIPGHKQARYFKQIYILKGQRKTYHFKFLKLSVKSGRSLSKV